jgi:hypothetical protein
MHSRHSVATTFNKYMVMTVEQLSEAWKDPKLPALDKMLIAVFKATIEGGDMNRLDGMLNRIIGKVRDEVQVSVELSRKTDKELLDESKEIARLLEQKLENEKAVVPEQDDEGRDQDPVS